METSLQEEVVSQDHPLPPLSPISLAPVNKEYVKPIYVWKTGNSSYITKKQHIAAETFLDTMDYEECSRAIKEQINCDVSAAKCREWLEDYPELQDYIKEQMSLRGVASAWTKDRWLSIMTDHVRGVKKLKGVDLYALKLIASVQGFSESEAHNVVTNIHIVQKNGRE